MDQRFALSQHTDDDQTPPFLALGGNTCWPLARARRGRDELARQSSMKMNALEWLIQSQGTPDHMTK